MKIEEIELDKIIPYENNPRKKRDIEKVANSIKEFGWQQPIVVDKNYIVIVGHTRLKAAAYRIADNKTNEYSDWDYSALNKEFTDLLDNNYELDNLGFDEHELESLITFEDANTKWLDQDAEWQGMPEYDHDDNTPFRSMIMHFMNKKDLETFLKLIKQDATEKTRWLYFPRQEKQVLKDKGYVSE